MDMTDRLLGVAAMFAVVAALTGVVVLWQWVYGRFKTKP